MGSHYELSTKYVLESKYSFWRFLHLYVHYVYHMLQILIFNYLLQIFWWDKRAICVVAMFKWKFWHG